MKKETIGETNFGLYKSQGFELSLLSVSSLSPCGQLLHSSVSAGPSILINVQFSPWRRSCLMSAHRPIKAR